MASIALLPAISLLIGVYAGIAYARPLGYAPVVLVCLWLATIAGWVWQRARVALVASLAGFVIAGIALGGDAAYRALHSPLRAALDAVYGGFSLDSIGPQGAHDPITLRGRLIEDAVPLEFGAALRVEAVSISIAGHSKRVDGGVRLTVSGAAAIARARAWRAGQTIEAPVSFRRPVRYLNDGVADFERDLALDGVTLIGTIKSAFLVRVVAPGTAIEAAAARLRAYVRHTVARRIRDRDAIAAAIVVAILIGDRSALPDAVRERLQAAGTYHVIAISGGNIAILAALIAGLLAAAGIRGRVAALAIICGLLGYSAVVNAGASVWRATATAVMYFAARLIDHRSPPWNAMAVSAAMLACASPLDVRDVGFGLTFGATAAILEAAARIQTSRSGPVSWLLTSIAASVAVEIILLPVTATAFNRATVAGVVLNLIAVPLMTIVQVAGIALVALAGVDWMSIVAATVADFGARGLVESARLVDVIPWLAFRVPPPPAALVVTYYLALAWSLRSRGSRAMPVTVVVACGIWILGGWTGRRDLPPGHLRVTMFDVGQGDAVLVQVPDGRAVMVDTGGAGFDGTAFDIGGRVLARALWARGIRGIDTLAMTHGDPDHIGGALAVLRDFEPSEVWEGVPVERHQSLQAILSAATSSGATIHQRFAGMTSTFGDVRINVLSPSPPDWERQRVRNDDSLVLEIRYRDVSILLTGDAGADIERSLLDRLPPARIRILKVGHHGSRTSSSKALLDAWKPQIALISCGRGNRFGHPAPEVIARLVDANVRVLRTDRDGQITIDTDGTSLVTRTFASGRPLAAERVTERHEDAKTRK